MVSVTLHP
jgi:hypothetical protein